MRRLIDKGRTWVKLSVTYDNTKDGPPGYADVVALGQTPSRLRRNAWYGAATGRIPTSRASRTTPAVRPHDAVGAGGADSATNSCREPGAPLRLRQCVVWYNGRACDTNALICFLSKNRERVSVTRKHW